MRKNRVIEQNRCYHLVSRLAHRAFFLDDEEKDCAVALMRRVEAGVQDSMSYCINRADPFDPLATPPSAEQESTPPWVSRCSAIHLTALTLTPNQCYNTFRQSLKGDN